MEFREYKVGDILTVQGCKTTRMEKISRDPLGKYEFVSQQATNNGVVFYTNDSPTEPGNSISVDGNCQGYCFYHKNPYLATNNMIKITHQNMSENKAFYICSVLNSKIGSFARGYKRSGEKLKLEGISLPSIIHDDGTFEPDWDYMENYIKELKEKVNIYTQTEINIINNVKKHRNEKIDVSEWKEYKMSDLFDISGLKGNKILSNNDVTEKDSIHNIASLGATDENNQIQGYVQSVIFEVGNFISCNVFTGKCFYQKENCVAGSHGLTKIKIKNKILNENISLFLIPLLNKLSNLYNRQHQRSGSVMKNETIKLPSILHDDGTFEPDWDYMENYIKELKGEKYEKHI